MEGWKSRAEADGGGGGSEREEVGRGSGDPGTLDGTDGRRLANRSSRSKAVGVLAVDGDRGGRACDSNSVMDGKWFEKDESASWSSAASSIADGIGGGGALDAASLALVVVAVDSEAGLVEIGGGERCLGGGSDEEWPCEMKAGCEDDGEGRGRG